MTKMEKVAELLTKAGVTEFEELLEDAKAEIKQDAAEDIRVDLKDALGTPDETAGLTAAIEIIESNYLA